MGVGSNFWNIIKLMTFTAMCELMRRENSLQTSVEPAHSSFGNIYSFEITLSNVILFMTDG